jgi:hypothetical protein
LRWRSKHDSGSHWLLEQVRWEVAGLTLPKPASPKARERAIRRLAEHGLTEEEVRAVLDNTDELRRTLQAKTQPPDTSRGIRLPRPS